MAYAHPSWLGTLLATAYSNSNPCRRRHRLGTIVIVSSSGSSVGGWRWMMTALLLALDRQNKHILASLRQNSLTLSRKRLVGQLSAGVISHILCFKAMRALKRTSQTTELIQSRSSSLFYTACRHNTLVRKRQRAVRKNQHILRHSNRTNVRLDAKVAGQANSARMPDAIAIDEHQIGRSPVKVAKGSDVLGVQRLSYLSFSTTLLLVLLIILKNEYTYLYIFHKLAVFT